MPRKDFSVTPAPTTIAVEVNAVDRLTSSARLALGEITKTADSRLVAEVERIRAMHRCAAHAINSVPTAAYYVGACKRLLSRRATPVEDISRYHAFVGRALKRHGADLTDAPSIGAAALRVIAEYRGGTTGGRPRGATTIQATIETVNRLRQQFWKWYGGSPYCKEGGGDTPERRNARASLRRNQRGSLVLRSDAERAEREFIELTLPKGVADKISDIDRLLRDPRCSGWERLRDRVDPERAETQTDVLSRIARNASKQPRAPWDGTFRGSPDARPLRRPRR